MHVLFVNKEFHLDIASTVRILRELAAHLIARGWPPRRSHRGPLGPR